MFRREKLGVCMSLQSVLVIFGGRPAGIPVIRRIGTVTLKSMEHLSIITALAATPAGYLACMMVFDEVAFVSWIQSNLLLRGPTVAALDMRLDIPSLIAAGMIVLSGARMAKSRFGTSGTLFANSSADGERNLQIHDLEI
jgi:hypothetical protein